MNKKTFVVSCQALKDEPLYGGDTMLKMARAAILGGADWIRTSQIKNIRLLLDNINCPIIGIIKEKYSNSEVFITPTLKELKVLIESQVDIIAIDATLRKRPQESLEKLIKFFNKNRMKHQKIMADCSNLQDILNAQKLGFHFIGTTLAGYTKQTKDKYTPYNDFEIVKSAKKILNKIPLIAEGGINTPKEAKKAYEFGADIVVIGSAITRPRLITRRFRDEINKI